MLPRSNASQSGVSPTLDCDGKRVLAGLAVRAERLGFVLASARRMPTLPTISRFKSTLSSFPCNYLL